MPCGRCRAGPQTVGGEGLRKRLLQLQSLASTRSWQRRLAAAPEMKRALDRVFGTKWFVLENLWGQNQ
jgi:polysaccharide biosynthesis protein PslH